jgi:hypothetical protein
VRATALLILILTATTRTVHAQGDAAETLRQAKARYEALDMERAILLLRQLVSAGAAFQMDPRQRAEAYKYLAASLAFEGKADSAVRYFRAAIERDPLVDLDPGVFTPNQIAALEEARRGTFALAVQPLAPARMDPRTGRFTFTVFSTHASTLRVEVRQVGTSASALLFSGSNDHLREIEWNGLVAGERLAPPGRYQLALVGKSQLGASVDSTFAYFDLVHERAGLQDTLPDLGADALLPERLSSSAAKGDLVRGLGVAAAALLISTAAATGDLDGDQRIFAGVTGGAGLAAGLTLFALGHREHVIKANVEENQRRRDERARANAETRRRNDARLAETQLVLTVATGAAR